MTARIFISRDSTALALGADSTARAIEAEARKRGMDVAIVRNGSRGMFWLEPLVEIDAPAGRIGFGPIKASDVPALFDAGFERGNVHGLRVGPIEMIPYFERQERLLAQPGFPIGSLTSSSGTSPGPHDQPLDTGRIPVSNENPRDSMRPAK